MNKVGVIVLNFKVVEETIKCIESIFKSDHQPLKIYVVDNNSEDGIEERVKEFKGVEFIQTGNNLGYAGGNNIGIKMALKDDCNFIFVVNPDTSLEEDTISVLIKEISNEGSGIVGPKIMFEDKKTIWFAGGHLDKNNVLGTHIGVDQQDVGQYQNNKQVDFITGAGMMVRAEVFNQVGLFDERYFLYLEDVDLCFRAKIKGIKVTYIPNAVMYHKNAQSTGLGSSLQDYFLTRNRMVFAHKFLSLRTQFALLREVLINIGNPIRRQAFFDFLLNNLGKGSYIK